jgi:hypothetical protein
MGAREKRMRRGPPDFGMEMSERVVGAKQRFEAAVRATGPDHANVLIDVCCLERGQSEIERASGWPQRPGKVVLQLALRQLARHYGLIRDNAQPSDKPSHIRHWATADDRPKA